MKGALRKSSYTNEPPEHHKTMSQFKLSELGGGGATFDTKLLNVGMAPNNIFQWVSS